VPHPEGDDKTNPSTHCTSHDSIQMTSYINHCTKQSYVPLVSCDSNGQWNCRKLISVDFSLFCVTFNCFVLFSHCRSKHYMDIV